MENYFWVGIFGAVIALLFAYIIAFYNFYRGLV